MRVLNRGCRTCSRTEQDRRLQAICLNRQLSIIARYPPVQNSKLKENDGSTGDEPGGSRYDLRKELDQSWILVRGR